MRRRLLLANSHAESGGGDLPSDGLPPESTSFGFPLYLNITKCDYESDDYIEYMRDHDDVSEALQDWLYDNRINDSGAYGHVDLGSNEIYINGCLVSAIIFVANIFEFDFKTPPFDEVSLDSSAMYGLIYK